MSLCIKKNHAIFQFSSGTSNCSGETGFLMKKKTKWQLGGKQSTTYIQLFSDSGVLNSFIECCSVLKGHPVGIQFQSLFS